MSKVFSWQQTALRKIVKLNYGKALPARERVEGEYNVYGSNGIIGNHRNFLVKYPTIIIGRKGSAGKVNLSLQPCWVIDTAFYTELVNNQIDLKYLYHFLDFISSKLVTPLGVKPGINRNNYLTKLISLPFKNDKPNLEEQKRIAAKIDKVCLLQEKSEKEVRDTEKLISSICRQEFEKKISRNTQKLGDLCNIVKGKFPTLKTPGGKYTFVVTAEKRKSANKFQFDGEAVCIPLVSSTGHGHASLHRIHYEKGKFALANIMVALIPKDKNKILARYLYYYLSFYKDRLLVSLMRGGANVTIPMNEIFGVEISIPEKREQQKLVSLINKVEELKEKLLGRQNLINQLFQSALNFAFQGKL